MADEITKEDLEREIEKILKVSDLLKISMKNLRQKLEKEMGVELKSWASTISKITMAYVDRMEEEREKAEGGQKSEKSESESGSESEDSEKETKKKKPAPRGRKRKISGDSDYEEEKKPKKGGGRKKDGDKPKAKGTGYTRAYKLSPQLSDLMGGATEMPRHEVVKRVWAIIKEKKLYDPSNKQFAICDDALYKVIGVKRFRTFGMMKYLKSHFLDD